MANSVKKTSLNNIAKYAKYLEELSNRRVVFNGSGSSKGSSQDQYEASIKQMKDIFKVLNHVKRNLRDCAKDNYMHSLDPYLREAHYDPKIRRILAQTAKKVISKEKNSNHEQKLDKQSNSNKDTQTNLLNQNKK